MHTRVFGEFIHVFRYDILSQNDAAPPPPRLVIDVPAGLEYEQAAQLAVCLTAATEFLKKATNFWKIQTRIYNENQAGSIKKG
jgi:hypothetical protein